MSRVGPVSSCADRDDVGVIWFDEEFLFLPSQASCRCFSVILFVLELLFRILAASVTCLFDTTNSSDRNIMMLIFLPMSKS